MTRQGKLESAAPRVRARRELRVTQFQDDKGGRGAQRSKGREDMEGVLPPRGKAFQSREASGVAQVPITPQPCSI